MRADLARKHNAAVGALVGLAVGDMLGACPTSPPTTCGALDQLPSWGVSAERSFALAERVLGGELVDMSATAVDIVATAIRLSGPDASPPLLGDPDAVLVCTVVSRTLAGTFEVDTAHATSPSTRDAAEVVSSSNGFAAAMRKIANHPDRSAQALTGALAGLRWGSGGIPATWSTTIYGPVGTRTYRLRQLRRLAERLLQLEAPTPPEPRRSLGPREVAPGLWLSNLHAVPSFIANHPDGAVISLCPTTGAFDDHPLRREFAMHDAPGSAVNPHLAQQVDDILATIAAFQDQGHPVLVHCHHGASRTGLVLRAWLIDHLGLDADDALTEAQVRWPKTSSWNNAFNAEIRRRCGG